MDGQLVAGDLLLIAGVGDQRLRVAGRFAVLDGPPDDVAAEHIKDHVRVEVSPLRGPFEFGAVLRPHLVGRLDEQLGFNVGAVGAAARVWWEKAANFADEDAASNLAELDASSN